MLYNYLLKVVNLDTTVHHNNSESTIRIEETARGIATNYLFQYKRGRIWSILEDRED